MLYFAIGLAIVLGLLAYWELVIAEGAHLGPRVVVWLYDITAGRYDGIKQFDLKVEADTLGLPLAMELAALNASDVPDGPRVLDVAAGTGRVARALLRQPLFDGRLTQTELSARMLAEGRRKCAAWPERLDWVRAPAVPLPFADNTFDAVTCLEALEFLPDARAALAECVRVLRPGGLLLVTNRMGPDAWLLPGMVLSPAAFQRRLEALPLEAIQVEPWQVEYDLGWAKKKRM